MGAFELMESTELISFLLMPISQVGLIIGIAQLIKNVGLQTRFIPVVDLILGLISGILIYGLYLGNGILNGIMIGIYIGLSACGLFSGIKNLTEDNIRKNKF